MATGGSKLDTYPKTKIRAGDWITPGPLERAPVERGCVFNQLRERLVAIRSEIDSILEQLGDRRIVQIQEPLFKEVEVTEDVPTEVQASFDFDGHTYAKVIPGPMAPGRYLGPGTTAREIDEFLQREILRSGREGSSHGVSMELEIEARRQRTDRRTDR